jgi:hypothetical protein
MRASARRLDDNNIGEVFDIAPVGFVTVFVFARRVQDSPESAFFFSWQEIDPP